MKRSELTMKRGQIISDFLHLEWTVSLIITYKYFKNANMDFLSQVMCDESMNFGLRMNILDKIAPGYVGMQKLRYLNKIRNLFAHCHLHISLQQDNESFAIVKSIHPKKIDEYVDFDKLYDEFAASYESVRLDLLDLLFKFGGKLEPLDKQVDLLD